MHWILQDNLFNEDAYQELVNFLKERGISHSIHKVIPFIGELVPPPELVSKNVICMGSYSLRHSARKYQWNPGVFDLEPYNFIEQRNHWGKEMLNYSSEVLPFGSVVFNESLMFIRPIEDSKAFAGAVFEKEEFEIWQKKVVDDVGYDGSSLTGETLIQVIEPKKIYAEYRFWIVKGEIITASQYKVGSWVVYRTEVDERFYEYVRLRINEWQPHDAFVVDVCDTPDGIKIVEINTLNSCGFYKANIPKLVMALESNFSHI